MSIQKTIQSPKNLKQSEQKTVTSVVCAESLITQETMSKKSLFVCSEDYYAETKLKKCITLDNSVFYDNNV